MARLLFTKIMIQLQWEGVFKPSIIKNLITYRIGAEEPAISAVHCDKYTAADKSNCCSACTACSVLLPDSEICLSVRIHCPSKFPLNFFQLGILNRWLQSLNQNFVSLHSSGIRYWIDNNRMIGQNDCWPLFNVPALVETTLSTYRDVPLIWKGFTEHVPRIWISSQQALWCFEGQTSGLPYDYFKYCP